jgi:hypothetical protein
MADRDNNTPHGESSQYQEHSSPDEVISFHYSRTERLRRAHRDLYPETKKRRWLQRKRTRSLLIILIDLVLIAVVFYFISKPANVFLEEKTEDAIYQLNITGIRGKKVLVGFTVNNSGDTTKVFSQDVPVTVRIFHEEDTPIDVQKYIEATTTLGPGESSSIIFLLEEESLPSSATVELFYGNADTPLFSKHVRF